LLLFSYGEDHVKVAKVVKVIIEKGYKLPVIVAVEFSELQSIPPQECVMIIISRIPNEICPDDG
jgi:hypothetical protein